VLSDGPIASRVGHGVLGLRDNLRPISELLAESQAQRHMYCDFRPGKLVGGWGDIGGGGSGGKYYSCTVNESFDGKLLDVVGIRCSNQPPYVNQQPLVRVESLATCIATLGTYYVTGTTVYVYLTNGGNPDTTPLVVQLSVPLATHAVMQPTLGPNKLADGPLDVWTTATNLTSWTEGTIGGGATATVNQDSTTVKQGAYSCRFEGACGAGGTAGGVYITQTGMEGVEGAYYRACGYYRTLVGETVHPRLRIRIAATAEYLLSDGINTGAAAAEGFALTKTSGEWRRFCFDFRCPTATADLRILVAMYSDGVAGTGSVWFDGLELRRIYRFELWEPRLDAENLPTIETARSDSFFGPVSVGIGRLAIPNGAPRLEALIASYDWMGGDVVMKVGGRFPNGGDEILFDECPVVSIAKMADVRLSDEALEIDLEDDRKILKTILPTDTCTLDRYSDLAERDNGRPIPLVFGTVMITRPARISKQTGTELGLGNYVLADVGRAVNGIEAPSAVWSYLDEQAADKIDSTKRLEFLDLGLSANEMDNALLTPDFDLRPIIIEAGVNDRLDFSVAGVPYVATFGGGKYHWDHSGSLRLNDVLQTALNAAGAGAIFNYPTYALATAGKATFTASAAFAILTGTGANKHRSLWRTLGFTSGADVGAAASQTSDTGMFVNCDSQHVLRIKLRGFQDDASGTYTGNSNQQIEKSSDIARCLLHRWAGVPTASIDLASFNAARSTLTQVLAVYVGMPSGERLALGEILSRIEASVGADITLEGGVWFFLPRDNTVPANVVDVYDYDVKDFGSYYEPRDLFRAVSVTYQQDASTGREPKEEASDYEVTFRYSRSEAKEFKTYLPTDAAALTRLSTLATQASTLSRRFRLTVMGKCLLLNVGHKFRITRTIGLDTTGALDAVLVRIISKVDDWANWTSDIEAIEVP
jgi:hypothetical protein